jgi:hypothetical protein
MASRASDTSNQEAKNFINDYEVFARNKNQETEN